MQAPKQTNKKTLTETRACFGKKSDVSSVVLVVVGKDTATSTWTECQYLVARYIDSNEGGGGGDRTDRRHQDGDGKMTKAKDTTKPHAICLVSRTPPPPPPAQDRQTDRQYPEVAAPPHTTTQPNHKAGHNKRKRN